VTDQEFEAIARKYGFTQKVGVGVLTVEPIPLVMEALREAYNLGRAHAPQDEWVKCRERLPKIEELPCLYYSSSHLIKLGRPIQYDLYWRPLPAPPEGK
jgi:hypothetical protein